MKPLAAFGLCLVLTACVDETISGYTEADRVWQLVELNGTPFREQATLRFPSKGVVDGTGPCNSFFARQSVPLPWISIDGVASTKRACPVLSAEAAYFAALQDMTLAEVAGTTLLLSNDETGADMVFRAVEPDGL